MIPFLSPQDALYCLLRVEGCDPEYAAMVSRDYPMPGVAQHIARINEVSPLIHARFCQLGRSDLIAPFEHPAPLPPR